jgi:CheY-like chemotaxis protein
VPGFGLGLTIVARLAELQDLSVSVRSIPGRGSWFQINGLALTRQAQSIAQADAEQSPDVAHTRVLVIDDDPKVLDATRALLEKWNFAVEVDEKFDPKKHRRPDILVCDYELSDRLDGFSVIQAARAAFGADLPAIMISGTTDESLAKRADQLGLPLLHKPVRPAQLRSALLHAGQGKH